MKTQNRIKRVLFLIVALFVFLVLYLAYFQVAKSKDIAKHPNNPREWVDETAFKRGDIKDRKGNILAESIPDESGTFTRTYPYGGLFSHIVGYSSLDYGRTGIEQSYNDALLNISPETPISEIRDMILAEDQGKNVVLNLDLGLQEKAYDLMDGHKGSIVLMDIETGAIHAMVSAPSYDPGNLDQDWARLVNDPDSALLNRSTSGLYTPGSVIKVITSIGILENIEDLNYYDTGSTVVDGYTINNYQNLAYGEIDLEGALVTSSNTYFVDKGIEVGVSKMEEVFQRFLFNQPINFDLPVEVPTEPFEEGMDANEFAAALYGQGQTLVTPLQMATAIAAIANEGQMVQPRLVKEIENPNTNTVEEMAQGQIISQVTDKETAQTLASYLATVVQNYDSATTYNALSGGKTGTAETASNLSHAWYVGFIPVDSPKYAVSVILEEDGTLGGRTAAPIGAQMLDAAYIMEE